MLISRPVSSRTSRRSASSKRFAELDDAAGQRPLAFARLVAALDEQRLAVAHDDGADADDRMTGYSRAMMSKV